MRTPDTGNYYSATRKDLLDLVPEIISRALDVGCGKGFSGLALREKTGCWVTGIEIIESVAEEAKGKLNSVLVGSADQMIELLDSESFDLLILGDVLEHMIDPEEFLVRVKRLIIPGGCVIISIPNVSHWSVVRMLAQGQWNLDPSGVMDRTHLRWFTLKSITQLLDTTGYQIEAFKAMMKAGPGMPRPLLQVCRSLNMDMDNMEVESICYQHMFKCHAVQGSSVCNDLPKVLIESIKTEAYTLQRQWDLKDGKLKYVWRNYVPFIVKNLMNTVFRGFRTS